MDYQNKVNDCTKKILEVAYNVANFDETRPEYHFHAPAQWMDDPNGIIYHNGYYHMMYSLNPDTDKWRAGMVYKTGSSVWKTSEPDWTGGITVWGHARSKDLIHWEHLPVALYPNTENGEYYIWFGCTAINDEGVPVAIYTSIGYEDRNPTDSAIQFIAFGDQNLIKWKPGIEVNPIMTEDLHRGSKIWEWRDPFLFRQNGLAYLILGGKEDKSQGGNAAVLLYEAKNSKFTKWEYKGVLFEYPDKNLRSVECPNIVNFGNKWILFISPHGPSQYFVGELDAEHCTFKWDKRGYVDRSAHFYATNVLYDNFERRLLWGAVEGFKNTKGWNGINSLPREIVLNDEGILEQDVPKEIANLRTEDPIHVDGKGIANIKNATIELIVKQSVKGSGIIAIGEDSIVFNDSSVEVEGHSVLIQQCFEHNYHIFVDKSVMEVFIDSKECFTAMIKPITGKCSIEITGIGLTVDIYKLAAKDLFSYAG